MVTLDFSFPVSLLYDGGQFQGMLYNPSRIRGARNGVKSTVYRYSKPVAIGPASVDEFQIARA